MKYQSILRWMESEPWAVHPEKMQAVLGFLEAKMRGDINTNAEQWAELEARRTANLGQQGRLHVMGLHGTISHKVGLLTGSGGTSTAEFEREFNAAMQSDDIATIVVDIDSPGGGVSGVMELSDTIHNARGNKRTVGVVNSSAYSAAYWLGAQFDELVVTPSGGVGSIGVFTMHVDRSKLNEQMGIEVNYIFAGKHKVDGNSDEPLSDDVRSEIQSQVDSYYNDFVDYVARGRGVTTDKVLSDFGQGKTFRAKEAVERGMADRVATFNQVLREESSRLASSQRASMKNRMRKLQTM